MTQHTVQYLAVPQQLKRESKAHANQQIIKAVSWQHTWVADDSRGPGTAFTGLSPHCLVKE